MSDIVIGDDIDEIIEQIDQLLEDENMDEAIELVEAAIERHPDALALRASRAEIAIENDEFEEGIAIIDAVLDQAEEGPERASLLNLKGYASFYMNDLDGSRRLFNEALREDPELWSSLVGRATTHERMGFTVAALLDLDQAVAIDDQEADPFAVRGRVYLRRGQHQEAARDFGYAIESDPFDETSRLWLARLLATGGAGGDAIEVLEPLIEHGEDDNIVAAGALLRSQLSVALGSTAAGAEDAKIAIDRWPDKPWGYLQLASCHVASMNPDAALKQLKEAEKHVENPRDVPDIFALRATAYDQQEKPRKAERERERVEGMARLPAIVYGDALNPASNVPINPNKPIDVRAILGNLFGSPERAPEGYEDALRQIIDQIPEIIESRPEVERVQIELPQVEGMRGGPHNLVIQLNRGNNAAAEQTAET